MIERQKTVRRLLIVAVGLLVSCGVGGCGGDNSTTFRPSGAAPTRTAQLQTDRFETGLPRTRAATPFAPPGPDTLPALADESISAVIELHNVALAASRPPKAIPRSVIAQQADDVASRLQALRAVTSTKPGLDARRLTRALAAYGQIATRLLRIAGTDARRRLQESDRRWRATVERIRHRFGEGNVPALPRLLPPTPTPLKASKNR